MNSHWISPLIHVYMNFILRGVVPLAPELKFETHSEAAFATVPNTLMYFFSLNLCVGKCYGDV